MIYLVQVKGQHENCLSMILTNHANCYENSQQNKCIKSKRGSLKEGYEFMFCVLIT